MPKAGDTLMYGMMMMLDGVWGHAVRCYRIGDADPNHERLQNKIIEYQQAFVDTMRPGADLGQIVRKGLEQFAAIRAGTGDTNTRAGRLGHALGYSYTDPGISDPFPRSYYPVESELQRSRCVTLQPGMVFELHPHFFHDKGAAGVGDMVEVTESGARFMTSYRRELNYIRA